MQLYCSFIYRNTYIVMLEMYLFICHSQGEDKAYRIPVHTIQLGEV